MATEKIIRIKVEDGDVTMLQDELKKLGLELENVEGASKKVDTATKRFGLNGKIISELNKLTGGWAGNILDVADGLKDVVKGINLSKTAMIATGIGAFVVVLGTIVAYWEDIANFITGSNAGLEEQKRLTIEINQALKDRAQSEKDNLRFIDVATKEALLRAKIAGASQEELTKIERDGLVQRLELAQKAADEADEIERRGLGLSLEKQEELRVNAIKAYDDLAKARAALGFFDLESQIPEKGKEQRPEKRKKESKVNPLTGEDMDAERERLSNHFEMLFDLDQQNKNALQESADLANQRLITSEELAQTRLTRIADAQAKSRERIAMEEARAKEQAQWLAADAFMAVSDLLGQETAEGKALAVASALVSTYLSAVLAYKSQLEGTGPAGPYLGAAAAAVAVVSGLASVKQILAVKVPGQGGGGGGIGGGSAVRPPSFNVVANNPQNQLNQALLEQNNEPVQAFVLEKEVTSAQEAKRNKVTASSL
jgi:hypothetical protein